MSASALDAVGFDVFFRSQKLAALFALQIVAPFMVSVALHNGRGKQQLDTPQDPDVAPAHSGVPV